jgi:hypothetical protein
MFQFEVRVIEVSRNVLWYKFNEAKEINEQDMGLSLPSIPWPDDSRALTEAEFEDYIPLLWVWLGSVVRNGQETGRWPASMPVCNSRVLRLPKMMAILNKECLKGYNLAWHFASWLNPSVISAQVYASKGFKASHAYLLPNFQNLPPTSPERRLPPNITCPRVSALTYNSPSSSEPLASLAALAAGTPRKVTKPSLWSHTRVEGCPLIPLARDSPNLCCSETQSLELSGDTLTLSQIVTQTVANEECQVMNTRTKSVQMNAGRKAREQTQPRKARQKQPKK